MSQSENKFAKPHANDTAGMVSHAAEMYFCILTVLTENGGTYSPQRKVKMG